MAFRAIPVRMKIGFQVAKVPRFSAWPMAQTNIACIFVP